MFTLLRKIRFKLWLGLSAVVDLVHPGYLTAEATVGRVQAFHDLLHETKMNRPEASTVSPTAPLGPVDQQARAEAAKEETADKAAKEIRNAFMTDGRLEELAEIVLDLRAFQSAKRVPSHILQQATAVFTKRYSRAMNRLLATGADTA